MDVSALDGVQAHCERLHECAERGLERVGKRDRLALVDAHVLGERARAATDPDEIGLVALRRLAGEARETSAASDDRERGDVPAEAPTCVGVGAAGDDLAAELVAHDEPRTHRRPQLEVRTADAACRHLQHELPGTRRRVGHVGDFELVLVVQHRGAHAATLGP